MNKISKQKFLTSTLLAILFLCTIYSCSFPIGQAANTSNVQEQTNSILGNLLGINPNSYATKINSQTSSQDNGLPQNQIDFTLNSNQSSVRVHSSFINNSLNMLYLSEYGGTLAATQPANSTAGVAKEFLENYQAYTRNSFYSTLAQTLDDVSGSASVTKTAGNVTLKVLNSNQATVDYTWTYTDANGIVADSKKVLLSYYQGRLEVFLDNWPFYNIIGTPTVPKQQAITNALAAVQNYTYQVTIGNTTSTVSVGGFQASPESLKSATLSYVNAPYSSLARDSNPFNLYPSWWIPIGFDKFYPSDVTGIAVTIWADTGQVSSTELMYADSGIANAFKSTASATQTNTTEAVSQDVAQEANQNSTILTAPAMMAVILCMGVLFSNRKRVSRLTGSKNLFNPMIWSILLCSIILLGAAISTVKADSVFPYSSARIYGAIEGTPGYPLEGDDKGSPPQSQEENASAYWVQEQLDDDFAASGYQVFNCVQGQTTVTNELCNAYSDATTYDRCTVFHYGHMKEPGRIYVDNTGNEITYSEIDEQVNNNKYKLVVLWVCCQAQNSSGDVVITDMCNAWMNYEVSSKYGYNDSDDSGQCFISFDGFSPWIGNDTMTFKEQWTPAMKYFIEDFYHNMFVNGQTIHNSLNQASLSIFNATYQDSILCQGYNLWWPGNPNMEGLDEPNGQVRELSENGWYPCDFFPNRTLNSMQVFGDSNIILYQPKITLTDNYGLSPTFYFDGHACGGEVYTYMRAYNVSVNVPQNYEFVYFTYPYMGASYGGNPSSILLDFEGELKAYFNWDPTYYNLTLSSSGGGSTDPSGIQPYLSYSTAHVHAVPNSGKVLDYWFLGPYSENLGNSPEVDIYMDQARSLQAFFTDAPSYRFVSSIDSATGDVQQPNSMAGYQPDGHYAVVGGLGTQTEEISGNMNQQTDGHIYLYGNSVGDYAQHIYVYIYTGGSWSLVNDQEVSLGSPYWIDCGTTYSTFTKIKVSVEDEYGSAFRVDSVHVDPVIYHDLTIQSADNGHTSLSVGAHSYVEGSTAYVTAYADSGYHFDHWHLDGQDSGSSNPKGVYMDDDYTLQPVFAQDPPLPWLSVSAVDMDYSWTLYPAVYVDSTYVGAAPVSVQVSVGWHTVEVEDPYYNLDQYCYEYFWTFSDNQWVNPTDVYVSSNTDLTAYYSSYGFRFVEEPPTE